MNKRAGIPAPGEPKSHTNATDLKGLYDAEYEKYAIPDTAVRGGEFRRRVPSVTTSRFAPEFGDYMKSSGSGLLGDDSLGAPGRLGSRIPYDQELGEERGSQKERARFSSGATSRFSEPEEEPETRRESYLRYLKERDPARRAKLYRDYVEHKAKPGAEGRTSPRNPLSFSSTPSAAQPFGFGLDSDRKGATTATELPPSSSRSAAVPRSSLFPNSRATPPPPPGLFQRSDAPKTRKATTGTSSTRPSSRTTRSAAPGLERSRDARN